MTRRRELRSAKHGAEEGHDVSCPPKRSTENNVGPHRIRRGKPDRVQDSFPDGAASRSGKEDPTGERGKNPAFRVLFQCVQWCVEAGVLRGDAFAISTIVLSAAHGAASLLSTLPGFPVGSRRRYAEEVVATTLSGL